MVWTDALDRTGDFSPTQSTAHYTGQYCRGQLSSLFAWDNRKSNGVNHLPNFFYMSYLIGEKALVPLAFAGIVVVIVQKKTVDFSKKKENVDT